MTAHHDTTPTAAPCIDCGTEQGWANVRVNGRCNRCWNRWRYNLPPLPYGTPDFMRSDTYRPPFAGRGGAPDAPYYDGPWGYQRPPVPSDARPLREQFLRTYPNRAYPVRYTDAERETLHTACERIAHDRKFATDRTPERAA